MSRRYEGPDPSEMMAVGVALFGECKVCRCLLDIDGTCPAASEHEKVVCVDCGAEHDAPITEAHPCLFCSSGVGKARARARAHKAQKELSR